MLILRHCIQQMQPNNPSTPLNLPDCTYPTPHCGPLPVWEGNKNDLGFFVFFCAFFAADFGFLLERVFYYEIFLILALIFPRDQKGCQFIIIWVLLLLWVWLWLRYGYDCDYDYDFELVFLHCYCHCWRVGTVMMLTKLWSSSRCRIWPPAPRMGDGPSFWQPLEYVISLTQSSLLLKCIFPIFVVRVSQLNCWPSWEVSEPQALLFFLAKFVKIFKVSQGVFLKGFWKHFKFSRSF